MYYSVPSYISMSIQILRRAAAGWLSVHTRLTARHAYAPAQAVCTSSASNTRGRTAGEFGDDAARSMQGAEDTAVKAGEKVESRVSDGGFVPSENEYPAAVPSPDSAGTAGGIGSETMGSMVDAMDAVMHADKPRAAEDLQDITADIRSGASPAGSTLHAGVPISKEVPGNPHPDAEPVPSTDTPSSQAAGEDNQDVHQAPSAATGTTIPSINLTQDKPELDQDPLARNL